MSMIKMNLGYEVTSMDLPFAFIDDYMTNCTPVYPLIYIWSLRRLLDGKAVSFDEIGDAFRLTESDVINAWKHWEKVGLVKMEGTSLTFLPLNTGSRVPVIKTETPEDILEKPESRPNYSAEELADYRTQSRDVERLFARAEKTLGKLLTYNDMCVIFSFHDWLRLPIDVIEYLFSYCAENNHRKLRYIEKCAMDWADKEINDLEEALTYVQNFDRRYRDILQYMGLKTSYPAATHRKFINRWLDEWKMPFELITEACDRSVSQINKPKFSYIDKILSSWNDDDIHTLEDVKALDEKRSKNTIDFTSRAKESKPRNNRFANFKERENDYDMYEKMERVRRDQKYMVGE